ncbi:Alpha/Beta hydrolase protein [Chaetomium sp. MPI-CAGE-AT-0009]|nr:Alpha/Beta hydrolase protein [Chaetomium sp. MPI-CAGE-AT-0009]
MASAALAQRYLSQATVKPHWLSASAFWYRRTAASDEGTTEFLFVDAESSARRPAFDHAALAAKLAEQTGQDINPASLPFAWIELDADAAAVRFRFDGKVFQFRSADGALEPWSGDFGTKLEPINGDAVTENGGDPTGVNVVNKTGGVVKVFWINGSGEAVQYGSVEPGKEVRFGTYAGHVWRVEGEGGEKAVYRAVEGEAYVVVEGWGSRKEESGEAAVEKKVEVKEERDVGEIKERVDGGIFVRDGHVWIRDADGEHQITTNDEPGLQYDSNRIMASPDGKFAVVWQYSPESGYSLNLIESTPADQLQPKLRTTSYLKPGDKVRIDRPRMFDIEGKREVPTDDSLFTNPYGLENMGWSKDGEEYRFGFNERGHKHLRVIGMNRQGAVRSIVEESSETFIDYSQKRYWLASPDTTELLWASERSGWNHLYLYDMKAGEVKSQVTQGEWVVRKVEKVDWEARQVWLTVYGVVPDQDPYYAHLARVNLDGSDFTVLTSGDGTHSWVMSPTNRYFIDTWSRVDQLPVTVLRDASSGAELVSLETDATADLVAAGWTSPERFTAPGRDNQTPIHGFILRPANLDPSKRYPIVEDIYAGPQDFFTPKVFTPDLSQREGTEHGFVMVKLDGMGTNWRSRAFHDVCYKNLKDGGIPDRIAWIQAAAATRPWMDASRVGIYGGSAGGQNAAAAVIFHGDFYKAAVADSGCHDNRMDKMWWNEQWMGWPVDEAYAASSNAVHAAELKGALMLIVGELDDNVDPSSTLQVVKALNDADKDYEMLLMPGMGHGAGGSDYGRRRRWAFLRLWLGESV